MGSADPSSSIIPCNSRSLSLRSRRLVVGAGPAVLPTGLCPRIASGAYRPVTSMASMAHHGPPRLPWPPWPMASTDSTASRAFIACGYGLCGLWLLWPPRPTASTASGPGSYGLYGLSGPPPCGPVALRPMARMVFADLPAAVSRRRWTHRRPVARLLHLLPARPPHRLHMLLRRYHFFFRSTFLLRRCVLLLATFRRTPRANAEGECRGLDRTGG